MPSVELSRLFEMTGVKHSGSVISMAKAAQTWRTEKFRSGVEGRQPQDVSLELPGVLMALGLCAERRLKDEEWRELRSPDPAEIAIVGAKFATTFRRIKFIFEALPGNHYPLCLNTLGSIRGLNEHEKRQWGERVLSEAGLEPRFRFPAIEAQLAEGIVEFFRSLGVSPWVRSITCHQVCAVNRTRPADLSVDELLKWRPEPKFSDKLDAWKEFRKRIGHTIDPPARSSIVIVASGPVWDRYELITQHKFPGRDVCCIGPAASAETSLSCYLSEIAKILHAGLGWVS